MTPTTGLDDRSGGVRVSGTIEFQDVRETAHDVTVHVRVQDTSAADARAVTVAEEVIRGVSIEPAAPRMSFTVAGIPETARGRLVVRVHADVDGSGAVSRGDYVSTQSHPVQVLGAGEPAPVTIIARRVG
jgi:hypothetical protein